MSPNSITRPAVGLVVATASVLVVALVASPLSTLVVIAAPLCLIRLGRGLPADERRLLIGVLAAALAARVAVIAMQVLIGLPGLNDLSTGALTGDESYYLSRALRTRDLLLGFATTKYDYFVADDSYGQTSYLWMLTWLQVIFGPTPYGMKVVNALVYVCGAGMLFRMARVAYGPLPAFAGLLVLSFLPSLFFSSISLLKESAYFFVASLLVVCAWRATAPGDRTLKTTLAFAGTALLALWLQEGLRRGGLVLMGGGLIAGFSIWIIGSSRARRTTAVIAVALMATIVLAVPSLRARAIDRVEAVAKIHAGHVFTVGHVYKLMDEEFYADPTTSLTWDLQLSEPQAFRFVARGAISFLLTPLPWQMRSTSELAFMPEHVIWYLLLVALPIGVLRSWRANPLVTALLLGFAIPTAIVVAYTNGNIGTLLRLRGLVTPYLVWLSAVGWCAIGERLASRLQTSDGKFLETPA